MKVILNTDIAGLGEEGNVVVVSPGYARNFLLPQKKVSPYNSQNISVLYSRKVAIEHRKEELRVKIFSLRDRLEGQTITMSVKVSERGQLYGAITSTVVAESLEQMGISVPKKQIIIPHHTIKHVGEYMVEAKLSHGVSANFTVRVVSDAASDSDKNFDDNANIADTQEQDVMIHDTTSETTDTVTETLASTEDRAEVIENSDNE